jgi:hypothetical protein
MLIQFPDHVFQDLRRQDILLNEVLAKPLLLRPLIIKKRVHLKEGKKSEIDGLFTKTAGGRDGPENAFDRGGIQPSPSKSNVADDGPLPALPDQRGDQLLIRYYPLIVKETAELQAVERQQSEGKAPGMKGFFLV